MLTNDGGHVLAYFQEMRNVGIPHSFGLDFNIGSRSLTQSSSSAIIHKSSALLLTTDVCSNSSAFFLLSTI